MSIESIVVLMVIAALLTLALWWYDDQKPLEIAHSERDMTVFN